MDQLTAKFLPRFASLARDRLLRAFQIANERHRERADAVVHDLHAIAGEAGLLGLEAVMGAARSAEDAARQFGTRGAEADAAAFVQCLQNLERAVIEAAAPRPSR